MFRDRGALLPLRRIDERNLDTSERQPSRESFTGSTRTPSGSDRSGRSSTRIAIAGQEKSSVHPADRTARSTLGCRPTARSIPNTRSRSRNAASAAARAAGGSLGSEITRTEFTSGSGTFANARRSPSISSTSAPSTFARRCRSASTNPSAIRSPTSSTSRVSQVAFRDASGRCGVGGLRRHRLLTRRGGGVAERVRRPELGRAQRPDGRRLDRSARRHGRSGRAPHRHARGDARVRGRAVSAGSDVRGIRRVDRNDRTPR